MRVDNHHGVSRGHIFFLFFKNENTMLAGLISRQAEFLIEIYKCELFSSLCSIYYLYSSGKNTLNLADF